MSTFEHTPIHLLNAAPSLITAALVYARTGIPVFPLHSIANGVCTCGRQTCDSPGKHPRTKRGVYDATVDVGAIRRWWNFWPLSNIGVPCGMPSGWWVLDIDVHHASSNGFESLAQLHRDLGIAIQQSPLYATRRQLTGGGGAHLIFQARTDVNVKLSNTVGFLKYPNVDLRVNGGCIVVAPSRHTSGNVYQWQNNLPVLPFPDVLIEYWRNHRSRTSAFQPQISTRPPGFSQATHHQHAGRAPQCGNPSCYLEYAVSQAIFGKRHNFALYLAYRLVEDVGMDGDQAAGWMCDFAVRVIQSPRSFDEEEALDCLAYVLRQSQAA